MLIDAHQHFWTIGGPGQSWPTAELPAIHRDFTPLDLAAAAQGTGLTGTILVQSQPSDADTDWLLSVATATPLVLGVVGWVDLSARDAPARIARLACHPKFRGLRPMLHELPDDDWIADPGLDPAINAMVDHHLSLDALIRPRHLAPLARLAARRPNLCIVIDHAAKPAVADPDSFAPWAAAIDAITRFPQVYCKISGLFTEAPTRLDDGALQPFIDHLLGRFGTDRLMWGSDWPVVTLRCSYAEWIASARRLIGTDAAAISAILSGTASRFYRLDDAAR